MKTVAFFPLFLTACLFGPEPVKDTDYELVEFNYRFVGFKSDTVSFTLRDFQPLIPGAHFLRLRLTSLTEATGLVSGDGSATVWVEAFGASIPLFDGQFSGSYSVSNDTLWMLIEGSNFELSGLGLLQSLPWVVRDGLLVGRAADAGFFMQVSLVEE